MIKASYRFFLDIFNNILGSVREALVLLDHDLKVIKVMMLFIGPSRLLKIRQRSLIYVLGNRQWDIRACENCLKIFFP
jgi:chemotaxis protein methyltransferase CheR